MGIDFKTFKNTPGFKRLIIYFIFAVIFVSVLIFALTSGGDNANTEQDDIFEDGGVVAEPISVDEYYGTYSTELNSDDMAYLDRVREYRDYPGLDTLWSNLYNYKFSNKIYFQDSNGEQVSLLDMDKPFMIYFASVYTDDQGNLKVDENTSDMSLLKSASNEEDPYIAIIPMDNSISREDFLSVVPNGNYFYSIDSDINALYNLVGDAYNPMLFFNSDGTAVFATINGGMTKAVDVCQDVFNQKLTLKEAVDGLPKT